MYFRPILRRAAVICAVVVGVAVSSWGIDAATTGVAVAPDKSDSTTEEIKQVRSNGTAASSAVAGIVANDLGPNNTQAKH